MKVIIVILCGLAMLFAGGCLVILGMEQSGVGAFGLPVFGVLAFNGFFMWAALNNERWAGPALMACGTVDLVICAFLTQGFQDIYVGPIVMMLFGVLAVKGIAALWLGYKKWKTTADAGK